MEHQLDDFVCAFCVVHDPDKTLEDVEPDDRGRVCQERLEGREDREEGMLFDLCFFFVFFVPHVSFWSA